MAVFILGPALASAGGLKMSASALDAGRHEEAAWILDAALMLQPDSAALEDGLGYVLYRYGDPAEAIEHFQRAVALDPELASARHNLGVALLAKGNVETALSHLEAAVDLDPGHAAAFLTLADAYQAAGRRAEAASAYQRAWSLDPTLLDAHARWAALILDEGRLEDARRAWLDVVAQRPDQPEALLGLGVVSWMEGRPAAALIHLQAAQRADPSNPQTYLYLGLAWQDLGHLENAADAFEHVLGLTRDPALIDPARVRLLEIYTRIIPANSQEGGSGAAVP
jgi:tetratricopeptide (TPR) repeat protein